MNELIRRIPTGVVNLEYWEPAQPVTQGMLTHLMYTPMPGSEQMWFRRYGGREWPTQLRIVATARFPLALFDEFLEDYKDVSHLLFTAGNMGAAYMSAREREKVIEVGSFELRASDSLEFDYRGCRTDAARKKKLGQKFEEAVKKLDPEKLVHFIVDRANDIVRKLIELHNQRTYGQWKASLSLSGNITKYLDKRLTNRRHHTVEEVLNYESLLITYEGLVKRISDLKKTAAEAGEFIQRDRAAEFSKLLAQTVYTDDGKLMVPESWLNGLNEALRNGKEFNPWRENFWS